MKNSVNKIVTVIAIVLLGIVVSCASRTDRQPSQMPATDTLATEAGAFPAECKNAPERQNLTDGAQTTLVIKCSCTDNGRTATWYNTVHPNVDPANYCAPGYPVFYESAVLAYARSQAASDASYQDSTTLPPMPSVLPIQPPASDAGAKPDSSNRSFKPEHSTAPQVTLMYRDVRYTCKDGMATRDYKAISQGNGQESVQEKHDQCVGPGFTCLTDPTEQRDPSRPPCNCTGNRRPMLLSAQMYTWACYDQSPNPRASASADAGSSRP